MKKYQIILTFLTTLFFLLLSFYDYESFRNSKEVKRLDTNFMIVDIQKRISINSKDIYDSDFKLWDLDIHEILEKRKKAKDLVSKKSNGDQDLTFSENKALVKINSTKRKICLDQKCWEFMGMLTLDNQTQVTLLSTDKKPKLETFSVGDELLKGLTISKITGDNMVVTHKKEKRKFILKLFEVNASAYFPKVIKEVNE